jgi:hypothetical protein
VVQGSCLLALRFWLSLRPLRRMGLPWNRRSVGRSVLWGTMYIPYRKAYLTGMNPLSFVTFFAIGELGMMTRARHRILWRCPIVLGTIGNEPRGLLFWLLLGGFMWVIGDMFQQYAVKYIGVSRGIPLSNTNQFWGRLWGVLAFSELRGESHTTYAEVMVDRSSWLWVPVPWRSHRRRSGNICHGKMPHCGNRAVTASTMRMCLPE